MNLNNNKIKNINQLFEALYDNYRLQYLFLNDNLIDDISNVINIVKNNKVLKILSLCNNKLSEEQIIEEIKQEIKIHNETLNCIYY